MNRLPLVFFLGIATLRPAGAWTLPPVNQPPTNSWTPGVGCGVIGGIPTNYTQSGSTITATGSDETSTINSALSAAVNGTYVLLGPGTHVCASGLTIPYNKQVILRGSGPSVTILAFSGTLSHAITMGSGSDYNWAWPTSNNVITAGLTKGSTQITIADTSAFSAGQIIQIGTGNDMSIPVVSVCGYANPRTQKVRVTSKDSTHLNFFPALYGDYSGGGNGIVHVAQFQANNAGLENLAVDCTNSTTQIGIFMEQCYNCWVNNVRVTRSGNYQIFLYDSLNCEIRHCFFDTVNGSGSNHAGVEPTSSCACLIEDNIIYHAFPLLEMWNGGNAGNVVAYNYLLDGEGGGALNTNHNTHNGFNLYEGNIAPNLEADGYFGSVAYDTIFRNWFNAIDNSSQTYAMTLKRFTRNYVVAGNIFQSPGYTWSSNGTYYGQPNIGNPSSIGTAQPSLGDWWRDLNSSGTTTMHGSLTTRTSATAGVVTLTIGTLDVTQRGDSVPQIIVVLRYTGGNLTTYITAVASGGTVLTVDCSTFGGTLPAQGTAIDVWAWAAGFQELDLDVQATTTLKGNYYYYSSGIPAGEALGTDTLPASLFRSSRPSWFGNLSWPAFDSTNPNPTATSIPAGYRYVNGIDPPGGPVQAPSNAVTTITTQ